MLKSKIFVVFFMVLIILAIFSVSSSAFSFIEEGKGYTFPEDLEYKNYTLVYKYYDESSETNKLYYELITSDEPIIIINNYSDTGRPYLGVSSDSLKYDIYIHYMPSLFEQGVVIGPRGILVGSRDNVGIIDFSDNKCSIVYSNHDVYDTDGALVFQSPVPMELGKVLEQNNPVTTFQITMSGIIISLIVFLVGLVAFLKAWSLLSKSLRKA